MEKPHASFARAEYVYIPLECQNLNANLFYSLLVRCLHRV